MRLTETLDRRFTVLVGNYGSGKTELSLNLALQCAEAGSTTLVDLDIVNPYFRSGEKTEELQAAGIRVLTPTFAMSTVDIPALPAEIQSVFETPCDRVVFDVGGDDTGAAALGRYAPSFARERENTLVALVVNCMRPLTQTAEDIVDLARRIEMRGRMTIDVIINNTNLADKTESAMLIAGDEIVREAAKQLGVSHVIASGMPAVIDESGLADACAMQRHMAPEWMEEL